MEAIATRAVNAGDRFVPPSALRAMRPQRAEWLRHLLRAALERLNATPRDVPPEFYRYPFP